MSVGNLIDIGVNLAHDSFDHDRSQVIEHAIAAGVERMIVTGSTEETSRKALDLARARPKVLFATAGVHPHHASEFTPATIPGLMTLAADRQVIAIGECGLDYFRDFSPRAAQLDAFERQLDLAATLGKAVFLHQRDAHEDFLAVLKEHAGGLNGAVAHCFTGTRTQMEAYLSLGLHIGVTGWICDERRGHDLRLAVTTLPLERVLIETDAPYLLPRNLPHKLNTRRNEPAFLPAVLRTTAVCMGVSAEELALSTSRNAERLFDLPAR